MSWDEQLLATASEDGCVFVYDVRDKDAKAAARREQERVEWAVEVGERGGGGAWGWGVGGREEGWFGKPACAAR
jgi:hypothetical protein